MLPYFLLFLIPAILAVSNFGKSSHKNNSYLIQNWTFLWWLSFILLTLMVGLRHEVGGDWLTYLEMLKSYEGDSYSRPEEYGFQDPAFILLYILAANSGLGIYLLNLISAGIFSYGLIYFCLGQPRPWLAFVVATPYLITVVAMGYTRQSVAIGIVMVALRYLEKSSIFTFALLIALAATFHKSALVLLPLIMFTKKENRGLWILIIFTLYFVVYELILKSWLESLIKGYVDAGMNSAGAEVRIFMSAIPALFFLVFIKRFKLTPVQTKTWLWMSLSGILLVIALYSSDSSTAIDRIGLYWIPLQIFVLSRIPDVLSNENYIRQISVYFIVLYSATVFFIWIFFADTSFAWIPYKFYPWVLLSQ